MYEGMPEDLVRLLTELHSQPPPVLEVSSLREDLHNFLVSYSPVSNSDVY